MTTVSIGLAAILVPAAAETSSPRSIAMTFDRATAVVVGLLMVIIAAWGLLQ